MPSSHSSIAIPGLLELRPFLHTNQICATSILQALDPNCGHLNYRHQMAVLSKVILESSMPGNYTMTFRLIRMVKTSSDEFFLPSKSIKWGSPYLGARAPQQKPIPKTKTGQAPLELGHAFGACSLSPSPNLFQPLHQGKHLFNSDCLVLLQWISLVSCASPNIKCSYHSYDFPGLLVR